MVFCSNELSKRTGGASLESPILGIPARRAGVRIPEGELPDEPCQLRGIVKL
jgi:hypothetical protein